jgi:acetylornithine deacetylase/succinyl-diaminopimelate desuccinylase-like protein
MVKWLVMKRLLAIAWGGLATLALPAADLRTAVESYVAAHQPQIITELVDLLSIPNVAADRQNIRRNASYLQRMLALHGLESEILETAGNPLVYGEKRVAGARKTVLFYAHYDGQPVNPEQWRQSSPFQPILRAGRLEDGAKEIPNLAGQNRFEAGWRIYARSASDDKAPIVALCTALDALKAAGQEPTVNVRVILDGEEEAGSPNLAGAIGRYRSKLEADVALIIDGPLHQSGRPTLTFGNRGQLAIELTVYGPKAHLHSGHYGNWIPNPAIRLAQLLASMKDDQGRVLIEGFYDGIPPLSAEERQILRGVPDDEPGLLKLFGVARPDAVGETLQEALQFPTLNVRGFRSGYVGADARTIIPSEATAALDIRLVKETPSEEMAQKVLGHLRRQGYHIIDGEPDEATRLQHPRLIRVVRRRATEPHRTELDNPQSVAVTQALTRIWGREPVRIRTSGGTVPLAQFIQALGFPAVGVPTVNFDNNQHGENENVRLGHLWQSIVTMAGLLTM